MSKKVANVSLVAAVSLVGLLNSSAWSAETGHSYPVLTSMAAQSNRVDQVIRQAFQDVLDREPSRAELRRYRALMLDEGWSERDMRGDLRKVSREGRSYGRRVDADSIVRRAYQVILNREPDTEGLRLYRSRIVDDGWSESQVRDALRSSPEHRERSTMTRERAREIVRRAYLSVFRREPDGASSGYIDRVLSEKWSQQDVERELRNSAEYRNRR